jgi:peptidyl-prolyl cis-trans isomerase D
MIRFLQTSGAFKKYFLGAILLVICISMAWYLVPSFTGQGLGGITPSVVATVEGQDVTVAAVERQARQTLEQQYPQARAQAAALIPLLANQAAQQLIMQKVMLVEANRMGLRATDENVRNFLHRGQFGETLFPGGNFVGQDAYQDFAARIGFTVPQLEQAIKEDIQITKLRSLIAAGASVTDADVKKQFDKQNTKVKFNYAVLKKDDILKGLHPAEAELKAYYDRNQKTYINSNPEKRQLRYVVIDNARMLASTQVTQQDLQNYYDQRRDAYRVPEQINARQILLKKPLPGTDGKVDQRAVEQAHAKADDVLKQLKSGGDFADLAKQNSEDADTAKNGGSLGWIQPDAFPVEAVSKAVSSLRKGGTSDVIDAGYAYVILHVDDKQEAHVKSLDEVKPEIEPQIKQQKAAQAAQSLADQVLAEAKNSGSSLEKAAAAKGLQLVSTDFVTSQAALPGIGNDQQFTSAAFAQTTNAPPEEVPVHQGYAIYQVTAVKPPATPTFEEIRSRVESEFRNERAAQDLQQKTQELSDRAKSSHDLKKAAKELGAAYKTSDYVLPDAQVPDLGSLSGSGSVAFTLKAGEISGPINNGNVGAVLSVIDRQTPTDQEFTAKKDQIREALLQQKQSEVFGLFLENLHDSMQKSGKIKINQKELDLLTKARTPEGE